MAMISAFSKLVLLFITAHVSSALNSPVSVVHTVSSVTLISGKEGTLTCNYNRIVYSVKWGYESTTSPMELLVALDNYYDVGKRSGLGYDEGRFNMTDDYSLIIHDVQATDEGKYICEIADFETGQVLRNHTDVTTVVIAERPFIRIEQCEKEASAEEINEPCVLHTTSEGRTVELTCKVVGARPVVDLTWESSMSSAHWKQVMNESTLSTRERTNGNGIFDQTLTVIVDTSYIMSTEQPFTCVGKGMAVDGTANSTIAVYRSPVRSHKTWTVVISVVCTLFFTIAIIGVLWTWRRVRHRRRRRKGTSSNIDIWKEGRTLHIKYAGDVITRKGAHADSKEIEIVINLESPLEVGEDRLVQEVVGSYHCLEMWEKNVELCTKLNYLFQEQRASLSHISFDSVHFFVLVKVGPDHDAFLKTCTDGTLARGLEKLLVTPELEQKTGCKLRVKMDVKDASAKKNISRPAAQTYGQCERGAHGQSSETEVDVEEEESLLNANAQTNGHCKRGAHGQSSETEGNVTTEPTTAANVEENESLLNTNAQTIDHCERGAHELSSETKGNVTSESTTDSEADVDDKESLLNANAQTIDHCERGAHELSSETKGNVTSKSTTDSEADVEEKESLLNANGTETPTDEEKIRQIKEFIPKTSEGSTKDYNFLHLRVLGKIDKEISSFIASLYFAVTGQHEQSNISGHETDGTSSETQAIPMLTEHIRITKRSIKMKDASEVDELFSEIEKENTDFQDNCLIIFSKLSFTGPIVSGRRKPNFKFCNYLKTLTSQSLQKIGRHIMVATEHEVSISEQDVEIFKNELSKKTEIPLARIWTWNCGGEDTNTKDSMALDFLLNCLE